MDNMQNEVITLKHSLAKQLSDVDNYYQSNENTTPNITNQMGTSPMNPTPLYILSFSF